MPIPSDFELSSTALARTEDGLLLDLGLALSGGGGLLKDGDEEDLRVRARNWLERNRLALRQRLCGKQLGVADKVVDVAVVADLISDLLNGPSAFSVAALFVKYGLHNLCEE